MCLRLSRSILFPLHYWKFYDRIHSATILWHLLLMVCGKVHMSFTARAKNSITLPSHVRSCGVTNIYDLPEAELKCGQTVITIFSFVRFERGLLLSFEYFSRGLGSIFRKRRKAKIALCHHLLLSLFFLFHDPLP